MSKPLAIIIQFVVIVACTLSVSLGYPECDCSCNVTQHGVTDVCNLVAGAMKIAERNEGTVLYLKKKYDEEISPFMNPLFFRQYLSTSTTPTKTETQANAPTADTGALEEIEKLKKQFENEQRRLEGKIESLEKHCLQTRDNPPGHILEESEETEVLQVENKLLLKRLIVAENRISKMKSVLFEEVRKEKERSSGIAARVSNIESEILKVKEEVFGKKTDGTANGTSQLEDGSGDLEGTNEEEEDTLKIINELVMQVKREDLKLREMLKAGEIDRRHLEKMIYEIRDKLTELEEIHNKIDREEIIPAIEDLKVHDFDIHSRLNALEMNSYRRNMALEDLQETMENYTKFENRGNLYKEISGVVFDTFQAMDNQVLPTVEEFREKSAHLEEVFVNSFSEDFSTAGEITVERVRPDDDDDYVYDPCRDASIDAVTRTQDGSTYFFKGDFYFQYMPNETIAYGHPRKIADDWDGLEGNLDDALLWSNGKTYFFKGERYWRFTNKKMDPNYPKLIHVGFKGIPSGIDAAYFYPRRGKAYFFKGGQYWVYDENRNPPVSESYPRPIFKGLPQDGVDAAFQYRNGRTYIFADIYYYRIVDITLEVDTEQAYPLRTRGLWFHC